MRAIFFNYNECQLWLDHPADMLSLHKLADVKLLLAEQPNKAGDPVALAELRRRTISPIMADQSVFNLQNAWHLSYYRAADISSA